MNTIIDEILFYGGISFSVCAVITAIIYLCVYRLSLNRLINKLESEYGKREQHPASNRGLSGAAKKKGK